MPPNSSVITESTASFAHTPIFRISEIATRQQPHFHSPRFLESPRSPSLQRCNIDFHTCLQTPPRSRGLQPHLHIPRFFESPRLQRGNSLICIPPNFSNLRVCNAATSISTHASKLLRDHGVYSLICTYPNFSNLRDCNEATASFAHPPIFRISEFATLQHPFPHMPPNSSEITGSTASFAHTPIFRISEIATRQQPHLHTPRFFESPSLQRCNINFHTFLQTPPRSRGLQPHLHIPRFFESPRLQRGNSLLCTPPIANFTMTTFDQTKTTFSLIMTI